MGNCTGLVIDTTSIHSILSICHRNWRSQTKEVILSAIVNTIWAIWYCNNQLRFENKVASVETAINLIYANVSLRGNLSAGHMTSDIFDFMILKKFRVIGKHNKAPTIKEIIWNPPSSY